MSLRVVVLGAGFGGLELTTILSAALGDRLDLTLIDRHDTFVFGASKLDLMFGRQTKADACQPYRAIDKRGVRFRCEVVTAIDAGRRRVTTSGGVYEADVIVIALGADYDIPATPGLAEGGHEFYSVAGAERVHAALPGFTSGRAIVGVVSAPFKCPPAPSEAVLLLDEYLTKHGVRDACEIALVMPSPDPVPDSPDASRAVLAAFAERDITFVPNRSVRALEPSRCVAILDDGSEMAYALFLGVPQHRVPDVVEQSGLAENGWIPVDPRTGATRHPGVYAIGDVANAGTPKAGVFAEGAARLVAQAIVAGTHPGTVTETFAGAASCYIDFGGERVGRVNVDVSGPSSSSKFSEPSLETVAEKRAFAVTRRARWFGL